MSKLGPYASYDKETGFHPHPLHDNINYVGSFERLNVDVKGVIHVGMYDFVERLVNIAIPRERDFRGLNPKSFDGQGNYSMGIKEQIIFPEINYDNIDKIRGMDICISTSASNKEDAKALLEILNFPFKK